MDQTDPVENHGNMFQNTASATPFQGWGNPATIPKRLLCYSWLEEKTATLITGHGDMTALALFIAFDIGWRNQSPYTNPIYLKAAPILWESPFFQLLNQLQTQIEAPIEILKAKHGYNDCLQDFPQNLSEYDPFHLPFFSWLVAHENYFPWQRAPKTLFSELSSLEHELNGKKATPLLVVLDGFKWGMPNNRQSLSTALTEMINRLRERGTAIIIVAETPPPRLKSSPIWDNIIEVRPWRNHHCGDRVLSVEFKRCSALSFGACPKRFKISSPKEQIQWKCHSNYYEYLKPQIIELLKASV